MDKKSDENPNQINIIYYDNNYEPYFKDILYDIQEIRRLTKGTLFLTINIDELKSLLNFINRTAPDSKFFLIMNGGSSEKVIPVIRKYYMKLFIKACIYTQNKEKYQNVQISNKDFVDSICVDCKSVVQFIMNNILLIKTNHIFDYNTIINLYIYKNEFCALHKYISDYYGNKNIPIFNLKIVEDNNIYKDFFIKLNDFYEKFNNNTNSEFIINLLKEEDIFQVLNKILRQKQNNDFKLIGCYVGNIMQKIVQYGKEKNKGVSSKKNFYKGIQINPLELLEINRNKNFLITFSHFMTVTSEKSLAEFNARRYQPVQNRKNEIIFSVMINIDYSLDYKYEPSVFDLSELIQYPDQEEFIILPFTFFNLKNIKIDQNKLTVDIDMEIIGKMNNLETDIQQGKILDYDQTNHIMISKNPK